MGYEAALQGRQSLLRLPVHCRLRAPRKRDSAPD